MDAIKTATEKVLGNLFVDHERISDVVSRPSTMPSIQRPTLEPMTREDARVLVKRLLAGFPNLAPHDPEGYAAALVQIMERYPKWVGERVITMPDRENAGFPPSDRLLRTWLEDAVRPVRFAVEWDARSARQIAERDR